MRTLSGRKAEAFVRALEQRGATDLARVEKQVRRIVADVRKNGDRALRRYADKWDGLKVKQPLRVADAELEQAWNAVPDQFKQALKTAATNIKNACWFSGIPGCVRTERFAVREIDDESGVGQLLLDDLAQNIRLGKLLRANDHCVCGKRRS